MSRTPSEPDSESEVIPGLRKGAIGPYVDESALMHAARIHGFRGDRPTEQELSFFPELWESKAAVKVFLMIRNTALATWLSFRAKECTAYDVRKNLMPPFNADIDFIQNIVHYLSRHGIINYGRYARYTAINYYLPRYQRTVIVIGAGASGIAAAMQLKSFGFDVMVIEGRDRIGGRVETIRSDGHILETGCDSLRNLEESPLSTLLHQVEVETHNIYENAHIFMEGKVVDPQRDKLIQGLYNNLKGALNYLSHDHDKRGENGLYISRQQAYENVFNMVERTTMINYYNYCKTNEEIALKREQHYKAMRQFRNVALLAERKLKDVPQTDKLLRKSLKFDMTNAIKKFEKEVEAFELCDNHLTTHQKNPCCKQYMHPNDYRNYNFLLAFEELSLGAQLEKVQFSCNTNDYSKQPNGQVTRLKNGLANMFNQVVGQRQMDIRLRTRVREIDYSPKDHVKVVVEKESGEIIEMNSCFVVSTLPIGVLKRTIRSAPKVPVFTPPLSEEKVTAIRSIGSALVNKVILVFEKAFWETNSRTQFATVSPSIADRATMLSWSSLPGSKVLTTYYVGEDKFHNQPDEALIANAMAILTKTFPTTCPKEPVSAHVTRWHKDEFAFGSGSFMSLRTEPEHFDELIKPLSGGDGKNRVYFAGEHTSALHHGQLEGAWMSGLRAAADLANDHIGIGFVDLASRRNNGRLVRPLMPVQSDEPCSSSSLR